MDAFLSLHHLPIAESNTLRKNYDDALIGFGNDAPLILHSLLARDQPSSQYPIPSIPSTSTIIQPHYNILTRLAIRTSPLPFAIHHRRIEHHLATCVTRR